MANEFMFDYSYVDLKNSHFESVDISETEYDEGDYEYKCKYKISVKFTEVKSDNATVNRYLSNNVIVDSDRLFKHYNERPMNELSRMGVREEDVKEGTVNYALKDFVDENINNTEIMISNIMGLFDVNILEKIYNQVYSKGKIELPKGAKVTDVEFDNRRHTADTITIKYEDGQTKTVQLKKPVTDDDVDKYIPGKGLFGLYYKIDRWLKGDYEGTINLLNNIFGVDLETLKGGKIK